MVDEDCDLFFFNDTAPTEIYTLSLHDALPISAKTGVAPARAIASAVAKKVNAGQITSSPGPSSRALKTSTSASVPLPRSEEHTSELQSRQYFVCRLLLEKKKKYNDTSQIARR